MKAVRSGPKPSAPAPRPATAPLAWALLAHKALFFLLIYAALHVLSGIFNASNYYGNFHWPADAAPGFTNIFKTWDAQLYLYLSEQGYTAGSPADNFYPLWPGLIRLGAFLTGGDRLISGLILANLLSLAGVLQFYILLAERAGERAAETSVLLLLAYPGALFLCFPFSESLFLFLVTGLFLALSRRRLGLAAAAAFLLPLSRPQGLLIAPALWLALLGVVRAAPEKRARAWALAAAPLLGFAAYLLFMRWSVGDAFAGFKTYTDNYAHPPTIANIFDPLGFAREFLRVDGVHVYFGSFIDRIWFVVFAAALIPLWRRDRLAFAYALPLGLVPALSLTLVSYTRHFLLVLPVFALIGAYLCDEKHRWALWVTLGALLSLQTLFLVLHVNNYWVG